jgi:hypothetical protein
MCGLDSAASVQGPVAGSSEDDNYLFQKRLFDLA